MQARYIIEKFKHIQVLIIGDVMIDSYLWGKVERISPEAPVPVVSVTKREDRLGGAANVALNVQALGATPSLYSVIGDDDKGRKLLNLLKENNISDRGIISHPSRKTTIKSRIISGSQHIARVDEETTNYIEAEEETKLITEIKKELNNKNTDVVIFVDYDKGVITPRLFEKINAIAQQKGILTAVDPKRRNFSMYKNVSLFKPNFKEFCEGTNISLKRGDLAGLKKAAEKFKTEQNFQTIFITLSELGLYIHNEKAGKHYPAEIRHIADVSGAGDSVLSIASLALVANQDTEIIARFSNVAGGQVCGKPGVVSIDKEQLIKEMDSKII